MKHNVRHIIYLISLIAMTVLFAACSSSDDEDTKQQQQEQGQQQEQDGELSKLNEKYESQPTFVQRFLKRYGRKGIKEAQNATVGTKNINKLRKFNRYYDRIGRQLDTGGEIVDSKYNSGKVLREGMEVFGWHPHYMGSAYESYDFNLLTTIAYFSYDVNPETGGYRSDYSINDWKTTGLIDSAHAKGCDVLLTITNHGRNYNQTFLNNLTAQQNLIDSVITLLELRNGDGINIDFESLPEGITDQMTAFVQTIAAVLKQVNPKYQITLALPAVDHTDAFDIDELSPVVDRFVIMGYDYHSGSSKRPGPVAPLHPEGKEDESTFNLQKSVNDYIAAGLPQSKMIMAFPYYGRVWEASNDSFSNAQFTQALTYRAIRSDYEPLYEMQYDSNSTSYFFQYVDTTTNNYVQCWFDNEISLGKKYDWVDDQKLRGIGIWALGYDNGYTELWSLIDQKFTEVPEEVASNEWAFTKFLAKNGLFVTGGIVFIILFMFAGLAAGLIRQQASHELFTKRWFLHGFIFVFTVIFLFWLNIMGWVSLRAWFFFGGIWLGYLIINYMDKLKISTYSDLP
mgnify:CR=1 FL=1